LCLTRKNTARDRDQAFLSASAPVVLGRLGVALEELKGGEALHAVPLREDLVLRLGHVYLCQQCVCVGQLCSCRLIGLIDCTRAELDDFLISYYSGFAMHRPVSALIGAILSVI